MTSCRDDNLKVPEFLVIIAAPSTCSTNGQQGAPILSLIIIILEYHTCEGAGNLPSSRMIGEPRDSVMHLGYRRHVFA